MSDKPYPWSRRMASDVEALDDIDVRYLKAGLRIEWALLQSRPPLIRSDDFWLRITGLKSKRSLELCLAHLAKNRLHTARSRRVCYLGYCGARMGL